MKKFYLISALTLSLAGITSGCSFHVSQDGKSLEINKSSSSQVKRSTSKKSSSQSTSARQTQTAKWDKKRDTSLNQAMQKYAQEKKIKLTKYDGQHDLRIANARLYPETFKKDNFYFEGKKISIGWSPQGEHKYDYYVMSIYNHDGTNGSHETYLFCLHENKPIILMDTTKVGKTINLVRSNDKELNNNFTQIMATSQV